MSRRRLALLLLLVPAALSAQGGRLAPADPASYAPESWPVPFGANTRSRDPFADAQGRVWFVGQQGNYVAYVDSRTKEFKRYEIAEGTHPHNLVVEKGMVWFTGNRNGRLVRLDPRTGKQTTYMIPDTSVRDPHTIDPRTMALRDFVLPATDAHPRRIAITSDDQVYWGDYTRGYLGHLDPRTGRMDEVPLPAGRASLPYGMTTDDRDVVWVAQNGQASTPASLAGWDPRSRRFVAVVPVGEPGPNTIRHMTFDRATRQIWFGTDQGTIGRISVPPLGLVP
jgi:virginiamycin B lyase